MVESMLLLSGLATAQFHTVNHTALVYSFALAWIHAECFYSAVCWPIA